MPRIAKKSVTIAQELEEEPEPEPEPEPESEPESEPEPEPEPPTPRKPNRARKNTPEPKPEPPTLKKKPGRPVGSKSKEPGKPRAKRVKIVEADEREYAPEQPAPQVQHTQRIPNDPNALMFQLLTDHARTRSNRKSDLWKSWFNR